MLRFERLICGDCDLQMPQIKRDYMFKLRLMQHVKAASETLANV